MLSDLLRGVGFEVVDLGADTPPESIVDAARRAARLVAVFIGATSLGHDASVRASVGALRDAGVEVPVLLGGAAIATRERAEDLGADVWTGLDGATAIAALERVIVEPGAD
jgi:methanogenic corrinoid protein MtbC1